MPAQTIERESRLVGRSHPPSSPKESDQLQFRSYNEELVRGPGSITKVWSSGIADPVNAGSCLFQGWRGPPVPLPADHSTRARQQHSAEDTRVTIRHQHTRAVRWLPSIRFAHGHFENLRCGVVCRCWGDCGRRTDAIGRLSAFGEHRRVGVQVQWISRSGVP